MYESIRNDQLHFPPEVPLSPALRCFISSLLTKDPSKRPDVATAMQHAWLADNRQPHAQDAEISEAEGCTSAGSAPAAFASDPPAAAELDGIAPALCSTSFRAGSLLAVRGQPREHMYLVL